MNLSEEKEIRAPAEGGKSRDSEVIRRFICREGDIRAPAEREVRTERVR